MYKYKCESVYISTAVVRTTYSIQKVMGSNPDLANL